MTRRENTNNLDQIFCPRYKTYYLRYNDRNVAVWVFP